MKHLFTIHSPLTFLVAYSIVEKLELDRSDVILISQKYKVPVAGFQVEAAFQTKYSKWYQRLIKWNVSKHYDKYIDELLGGEKFIAYVDLMSYYQKILVTHSACQAFHFMEEGNSAYQAKDDLTDLSWPERQDSYRNSSIFSTSAIKAIVRTLRGYNLRLLSIPYHYMAFSTFEHLRYFCFSANAFYNAPVEKKVMLQPDTESVEIREMAAGIRLNNAFVWIDGSNGRFTGLPEDFYHRAIDKAIIKLIEKNLLPDKIYVKLRPGIKDYRNNELVKKLMNKGVEVEVLPDNLVLESFFITSNDCTVVGTLSAALEYAYVFGHRAYSIYGLFDKRPPTFFDRMDGFWENVELL